MHMRLATVPSSEAMRRSREGPGRMTNSTQRIATEPLINPSHMEHLFKTQLTIDGAARSYDVFFKDEEYHFAPLDGEGPEVRLRREEDEWQPVGDAGDALTEACINILDQYLLSQH